MSVTIPQTQAASSAAIGELLRVFGRGLPAEFLEFLMLHDGATPEDNVIKIGLDNESGVHQFISANDIVEDKNTIEYFPENAIPIAYDECGNFFYINQENHAVYFWEHEIEGDDFLIARTFGEFLKKLEPYVATASTSIGTVVWVDPNFKPKF